LNSKLAKSAAVLISDLRVRNENFIYRNISGFIVCVAIAGCSSGGSQPIEAEGGNQQTSADALSCNDGLKSALTDGDITVLTVKQFKQGEPLLLSGTPTAATPAADADLCLVKLLVGHGKSGPADAPSTSTGIGIEVWLPSHTKWNERIRVYGNGGWAGTDEAKPTIIADTYYTFPHYAAAGKGYVVATSDNGHTSPPGTQSNGSFIMNPDGTVNTVGWHDFSERSVHVLAEKSKATAKAFYGKVHKFA
jgi:hypothetical protein